MDMEVLEHSLAIAFGSISVIYICIIFPVIIYQYIIVDMTLKYLKITVAIKALHSEKSTETATRS